MDLIGRLRSRYDGAVLATLGGIIDRARQRGITLDLDESDRLDGKRCLVTGCNRGLGLAIAKELARRGGDMVLACRSGLAQARAACGGEPVRIDLADLASVERAVRVVASGPPLDVAILNAAIVPRRARRTCDGFDESFQVVFLANVLLIRRLIELGAIADGGRIVVVSSEAHRSAPPIDWSAVGRYRAWGALDAVEEYGKNKLLMLTFTEELGRRTALAVYALCPGAVRSDIGREAPSWAKPALDLAMRAFFQDPDHAAEPVVYLAASRAIEARLYLHGRRVSAPSEQARSPENGRRIWDGSAELLRGAGHGVAP